MGHEFETMASNQSVHQHTTNVRKQQPKVQQNCTKSGHLCVLYVDIHMLYQAVIIQLHLA